jgi:hypothetical protein
MNAAYAQYAERITNMHSVSEGCAEDIANNQVWVAGEHLENSLEDVGLYPMSEPLEHRVPVAKDLRQVAPRAACPRDPQHRLEEQSRVPSCSARVRRRNTGILNLNKPYTKGGDRLEKKLYYPIR